MTTTTHERATEALDLVVRAERMAIAERVKDFAAEIDGRARDAALAIYDDIMESLGEETVTDD